VPQLNYKFFDLISYYHLNARCRFHWELDDDGQPTQKVLEIRRHARFIAPIPKPKKRKGASKQEGFVFDDGKGLSTKEQQYDPTSIINEVRGYVDTCRSLPNPNQWQVVRQEHLIKGFLQRSCQRFLSGGH
jgi:hypothetical protein